MVWQYLPYFLSVADIAVSLLCQYSSIISWSFIDFSFPAHNTKIFVLQVLSLIYTPKSAVHCMISEIFLKELLPPEAGRQ